MNNMSDFHNNNKIYDARWVNISKQDNNFELIYERSINHALEHCFLPLSPIDKYTSSMNNIRGLVGKLEYKRRFTFYS
jgi:hypothetical protein